MFNGGPVLLGRWSERQALDRLLADVRTGRSQAVVLRGEPGIGKTALLDYAVEHASGCRIARAVGVESEMELAFAGLHQLCGAFLGRLACLPAPRRDALSVAFGLSAGELPERLHLGVAVLDLLSEVAKDRPLVCVIDDVQWLDRASTQTLAFVARRLQRAPVGLFFAVRDPAGREDLAGIPELVVPGLPYAAARDLLESATPSRLDPQVRDRIVAETRGNPLALLELPRGSTPAELAGGLAPLGPTSVAGRVEANFRRRLETMPRATQLLVLTAAAEPIGDAALLWRAAERLGIDTDAAAPAEAADLIEFGARVRFRHPLVRSAVYRRAGTEDRRDVHRALAEASDPVADRDRRAWHLAHAAAGPDEAVAAELERSATIAQRRGGIAAAAAFLDRATQLTPDPARRGERALAAAQAMLDAADIERGFDLLANAELASLDRLQRARVERLRVRLTYARGRGRDGPGLLLDAARRLEPLDGGLAREAYLDALAAAIFAGRRSHEREVREAAEAALAAAPGPHPPRAIDLLLDGLATRFTAGYVAAVPLLTAAVNGLLRERHHRAEALRFMWLACSVSHEVWDDAGWDRITADALALARDTGALTALPTALTYRAGVEIYAGRFVAAAALIEEANALSEVTGTVALPHGAMVLAAWRGRRTPTLRLIDASVDDAVARGEGRVISVAEYARAVLYQGQGEWEAALDAAQRASEHAELGLRNWILTELIEAGVHAGRRDVAARAFQQLEQRTRASGGDWALGSQAASRALLSDGTEAERLYEEAIERIARTRVVAQRARVELLYGEWLRRQSRLSAARAQLRAAHEHFSAMGADAFAERARRALLATGEKVRRRNAVTHDELTAQQRQIVLLAARGQTNAEIGSQLFISPRTVEWHMKKIFAKLDIKSRKQLREALPAHEPAAA